MPLQKSADFEDCSHDRWGTTPRYCINEAGCVVCNALNSRTLGFGNTTTIKNCFLKCGFSTDHVSHSDDSAVKLNEDEEDDWHSLQALGVQSEDYPTRDSALEVCGVLSVDKVLDQHFTWPEQPEEEEQVSEHKATFFDALKDWKQPESTYDNLIPETILL
jgi:hypothetical protein